jgi:hypothetical protein
MSSITVPFKLPDLYAGFAEGKGLAKASDSELILEFVVEDSVINVFKTGVKEIHIPRAEIDVIQLRRGWFGEKLRIRVKSMRWLADLPGCDTGEVTLRVARRDRAQAANLVQALAPAG